MAKVNIKSLQAIPYLDTTVLHGRTVQIMALWDGERWSHWLNADDDKQILMHPIDIVHASYVAKSVAREDDVFIPFLDFMWQRASWSDVVRLLFGLQQDFHLLATSAAKLRHYFATREQIDKLLIRSFVQSELEYLLTASRSAFDLLQEIVAKIWNGHIQLLDPEQERLRKRHKLPETFSALALDGDTVRTPSQLIEKFALPPSMADLYAKYGPYFSSLRSARDSVVHGGSSIEAIYVTDDGFCVSHREKVFANFDWQDVHKHNENVSSLYPWVAHVVQQTLGACSELMEAFATVVAFPPEIAPGYHVFQRDPANRALLELSDVAQGKRVWWSDRPVACEVRQEEPPASSLDAKEGAA